MSEYIHLQVRNPKDDETTLESATQIFSSIFTGSIKWSDALFNPPPPVTFEIYMLSQRIYFYISCPPERQTFIKSLLTSTYPNVALQRTKDPLEFILKSPTQTAGEVVLTSEYYLPIKTYQDFSKVDPLTPVLGFLARSSADQAAAIQITVSPPTFNWQSTAIKLTQASPKPAAEGASADSGIPSGHKSMISKKTMYQGGKVEIKLLGSAESKSAAASYIRDLAGTFGTFSLGEGNQFKFRSVKKQQKFIQRMHERSTGFFENRYQILNAAELASLWHPPGALLAGLKNMAWGKSLSGEAPENIPIAANTPIEERENINFFAKTEFKNQEQIIGISAKDRRRHVYIIGKTGTGKSTLIANMAIDDIRRGRGIGIIDPHGDLTDSVLDYIPKRRVNDVVYLEPFDNSRPFNLNILEVHNHEQKHLVSSGIVGIFKKLYGDSWGPRLEYILRNVILTLLEIEGATLYDALRLMSDAKYRKGLLPQVKDTVILNFWYNEFDRMQDRQQTEAISPIQNKLGQFVTSPMIRNIIAHPKSSIDLSEIMDEGKILLLNLSQGKLGEDNAALLGAMFITQIQIAAMGRSFKKEEDRRDFFLYVDEFQNFATSSFVKILSEARKYRLALTLANQYIDQLDEEVGSAIFGNAGTLISFVVGARDAAILSKEYGGIYSDNDLVSLGKFEIVLKISIDNQMSSPFPARTLPPPSLTNDNRDKIIKLSKEKYGRKVTNLG